MGMFEFDRLRCEATLPDEAANSLEFQTKDLERRLDTYTISKEGRLTGPAGDIAYHGYLNFYAADVSGRWYEYRAKFTDGRLVHIEKSSRDSRGYPAAIAEEAPDTEKVCARAEIVKHYHGHEVRAFIPAGLWEEHPFPWRFTVRTPTGELHRFTGIPNQCQSARSALGRGWWRAKWLADGSFGDRYR